MNELKLFAEYVNAVHAAQIVWIFNGCNDFSVPTDDLLFGIAHDLYKQVVALGPDAKKSADYIWAMFLVEPDEQPLASAA